MAGRTLYTQLTVQCYKGCCGLIGRCRPNAKLLRFVHPVWAQHQEQQQFEHTGTALHLYTSILLYTGYKGSMCRGSPHNTHM